MGSVRAAAAPQYAEARRQRDWSDREPTPIDVETFVDDLIPRLLQDEVGIAAFPRPDRRFTPDRPVLRPD
jgi:Protein of unknown function (DUF2750)